MKNNNCQPSFLLIKYPTLLFLLFAFVGGQSLSSCTSKKEAMTATSADTAAVITYTKVRGRGTKLPVYTLEVLDSKTLRYTAIMNVKVTGEQLIPLKKKEYDALVAQFKAAKFKDFEPVYKTKMRDLPLTRIAYEDHTVTYQAEACPDKLKVLADLVAELVVL